MALYKKAIIPPIGAGSLFLFGGHAEFKYAICA